MRKFKEWEARQDARLDKFCSLDMGDSGPAPTPDPAIGQAAAANAEIAKEMAALSREEFEYRRTRDAELKPTFDRLTENAIKTQEQNLERGNAQWDSYNKTWKPIEEEYAAELQQLGSKEEQAAAAGRAVQDVNRQYDVADASTRRNLARVGGTTGGAFQVGERMAQLARAGSKAGAATSARQGARMLGVAALEAGAKFGRGLPSTGIAADSLALNAGGAAGGAAGQQATIHNAGVSTAGNLMSGAVSANNSAGNMLATQFNAQNAAYNSSLQANRDAWGGLGTIAGIGGAIYTGNPGWMNLAMKDGGPVRLPRMIGYANGGEVHGPGGPRDDAVPATVNGHPGVRLSDGEWVIKADSVERYGPRLLAEVNEGTAIIIPTRSPRRLRAAA